MDAFYGHQYGDGFTSPAQQNAHDEVMSGMDDALPTYQTQQQQSSQLRRHPSVSSMQGMTSNQDTSNNVRRQSMPEFSGSTTQDGQLNGFLFAPMSASSQTVMMPAGATFQNQTLAQPTQIVTQYIGSNGNQYSMMSPVQTLQQSPMHMSMQGNMRMPMPMPNQNDMVNNMQSPMAMTSGDNFAPALMAGQMPQAVQAQMSSSGHDSKAISNNNNNNGSMHSSPAHQSTDPSLNARLGHSNSAQVQTPSNLSHVQSISDQPPLHSSASPFTSTAFAASNNLSQINPATANSPQARFQAHQQRQQLLQLEAAQKQWAESQGNASYEHPDERIVARSDYSSAYSATGFDMLNILVRVATRPNPEINIGAVDLSCAFVVCDALEHDFPIVYVSENFERLTGYTKHEILGRNCRFLQSPTAKVQPGVKRQYVDDESVMYLKNMITQRREAQVSLINYRKGGQPFMNLLTMIPVRDDDGDVRYFVGFQVDLVEQPNSVTNKNRGTRPPFLPLHVAMTMLTSHQMVHTRSITSADCPCRGTHIPDLKARLLCPGTLSPRTTFLPSCHPLARASRN